MICISELSERQCTFNCSVRKNCHALFFRVSPCCAGCKGCWRMFERGALLAWSCWKPVTGTKRGAGWPPWGHFLSLRKKMVESSQGAPRDQSYNKKFKKPFIMIPIKSFNKNRLIIVKLHSFSLFSWLIFFLLFKFNRSIKWAILTLLVFVQLAE